MTLSLPGQTLKISPMDELGKATFNGHYTYMQEIFDGIYEWLCEYCSESRAIWDLNAVRKWGRYPASEAQLKLIQRKCKGFDASNLNKMEASQILNRVLGGRK